MSKVRFFALGGLGENGKNMYVVEVDTHMFILDAGLKYPSASLLGVDTLYPDMSYLEKNKDKIQGIFLSHGHEDHIGAVVEVLKRFNIGVFGTHFTISLLENAIQEAGLNIKDYRLYRINEDKILTFGDVKVEVYNVSHGIPEAVHIAIITSDGAIVYAPDFNFDINPNYKYHISFNKINEVAQNGVLAVCSESLGSGNISRTTTTSSFDKFVNTAISIPQRVIFTLFSTDLAKIQRVVNWCVKAKRKIAVIGIKSQKIIAIAMSSGYLNIPPENLVNLKFRTDKIKNEDKDLVVIVTGIRHEPFYMLQRMCRGQDRLIQINKEDEVIMMTPPVPGTERMAARTLDTILMTGAKGTLVNKNALRSTHADGEDLRLLYNMLKPKYIIPIIGEYRHQYQQKEIAVDAGYDPNKVIILENGQVATFTDGVLDNTSEKVSTGDVLVNGSIVGDINEVVLKDRDILSEEGIIFVTTTINRASKTIIGGPIFETKGFNSDKYDSNLADMEEKVVAYLYKNMGKKNAGLVKIKEYLRDDLSRYIYREMRKRPIIIITIIDISRDL